MLKPKKIIVILLILAVSYLFISRSCAKKIDTIPAQNQDFCSKIHLKDTAKLSNELKPFETQIKTKTGVYILEDGNGSLVTRAWLCEHAEKTIDVQYFIFSTDNVGLIACDYLIRAADRGVKVRIIVDDIMVEAGIHEILTMSSHKNISIKIYNPGTNLGKNIVQKLGKFATHFREANQRMHNKVFAVDNKVVITGGRNIADEYFDYDHEYNFRDRDVLLMGKVTKEVNTTFETFWNSSICIPVEDLVKEKTNTYSNKDKYERLHQYACNPENFWPELRTQIQNLPEVFHKIEKSNRLVWVDDVKFVSDLPGKNDGSNGLSGGGITTKELINLIKNAKDSIDIQSPYLITTKLGQDLFKEATDRGVKIRILTNSLASTDNLEAFAGYQQNRKQLLESGVSIYEFRPDAAERMKIATGAIQKKLNYKPIFGLHAKSMVIDGKITVIGTFNLDPRSANLNTECFAVINSKTIAKGVLKGMEEEYKLENSWHTTLDFNPDSEVNKVKRLKTFIKKIIPKNIL
ncbi:phospholipase D family protein [Flavobacterium sp. SUN052]|uniref:phospholipase D family protein n=1 Tax=Flavobacterium sp. SUN052 TaxID=3002441 RepID=UPI00237E5B0E|nr:phospholipase D family protein [Flavobacterium sp. SUN052]MEC4004331.1 phospholipase D family protein [Flavobacterium sp. SUN052]